MREREGEKGESVCEGGKKKVGGWLGVWLCVSDEAVCGIGKLAAESGRDREGVEVVVVADQTERKREKFG